MWGWLDAEKYDYNQYLVKKNLTCNSSLTKDVCIFPYVSICVRVQQKSKQLCVKEKQLALMRLEHLSWQLGKCINFYCLPYIYPIFKKILESYKTTANCRFDFIYKLTLQNQINYSYCLKLLTTLIAGRLCLWFNSMMAIYSTLQKKRSANIFKLRVIWGSNYLQVPLLICKLITFLKPYKATTVHTWSHTRNLA